jgi:hypothetical protein
MLDSGDHVEIPSAQVRLEAVEKQLIVCSFRQIPHNTNPSRQTNDLNFRNHITDFRGKLALHDFLHSLGSGVLKLRT